MDSALITSYNSANSPYPADDAAISSSFRSLDDIRTAAIKSLAGTPMTVFQNSLLGLANIGRITHNCYRPYCEALQDITETSSVGERAVFSK